MKNWNLTDHISIHRHFNVASINPSSDNLLVAYAEDLSGRREYNIKVKDLSTGKIIDSAIQRSSGSVVWDKQNTSIYYAQKDPVTLIENKVFKPIYYEATAIRAQIKNQNI